MFSAVDPDNLDRDGMSHAAAADDEDLEPSEVDHLSG